MTDLGAVLVELKKERDKLDRAIAALSGVTAGKRVAEGHRDGGYRQPRASGSQMRRGHAGQSSRQRRKYEHHDDGYHAQQGCQSEGKHRGFHCFFPSFPIKDLAANATRKTLDSQ